MKKVRLFIADDHAMVRQGIRALLQTEPEMEVVGEAATGLETMEAVEEIRPDVLLLDLVMPELDGMEVARLCHRRWPDMKVVVVTMHSNEAYVFKALQMGAQGYVVKDCDARTLLLAIRSVMNGQTFLSPPLSHEQIQAFAAQTEGGKVDLYDTLTKREKQVLQLTAEGYTNVRMAEKLGISPRTVEVHRANLMKKLHVGNHSELVRYTFSRGLIPYHDMPPPARGAS